MPDETSLPPADAETAPMSGAPAAPEQIGRYRILERIGEGGMGTVYKAEQRHPIKRVVAVKIVKAGFDTREVIARFESERQALARMDHPNIARVLDAGSTESGHPYFVMEYVAGRPITQFADENKLTIAQRLELFTQVCAAVTHAHTKAIIHRDLKASNVLALVKDGTPAVKVIDFGVAKALTADRLTDQTFNTASGVVVGTYDSMSPEQADGSPDIDTRTDVYSLGVLLYELLTGVKPFEHLTLAKAADAEIRRMIREEEPIRPSTRLSTMGDRAIKIAAARQQKIEELQKNLKHELEWIPLKAMSKERARRYTSAGEMAIDLENYLSGRPLMAAPDSRGYLLRKFVRRHRGPLVAATLVGLALLMGIAGTTLGLFREHRAVNEAREQRAEAVAAKSDAESQANLARKAAALSDARYLIHQAELPEAIERIKEADSLGLNYNERLVLDDVYKAVRGQWKLRSRVATEGRCTVACWAVEEDGDNSLINSLFAARGRRIFRQKLGETNALDSLDLDGLPPDELVATPGKGGVVLARCPDALYAIDPKSMKVLATKALDPAPMKMAASKDSVVVVQQDGTIRLLDARTLEEQHSWKWSAVSSIVSLSPALKCFIAPDGKYILLHNGAWNKPLAQIVAASEEIHRIDHVRMGHLVFSHSSKTPDVFATWFSPSFRGGLRDEVVTYRLGADGKLQQMNTLLIDSSETKERSMLRWGVNEWDDNAGIVAFGQVGLVEIAGEFSRVNPFTQRYRALWPFDADDPKLLAANMDGDRIALATNDSILVFRRDEQSRDQMNLDNNNLCAIPGGVIVMNQNPGQLGIDFYPFDPSQHVWDLNVGWLASEQKDRNWIAWLCGITPDGRHAAVLGQETDGGDTVSSSYYRKCALIYDTAGGLDQVDSWKPVRRFELPEMAGMHGFDNRILRLTPDGAVLLFGDMKGMVCRYDASTGKHLSSHVMTRDYDVSADGQFIAGAMRQSPDLVVIRVSDGSTLCTMPGMANDLAGCCFSSQNKLLLVSHGHSEVEAFGLPGGTSLWRKPCNVIPRAWHEGNGVFIGVAAEGSGSTGAMCVLADQATLKPLSVLSRSTEMRNFAGFSPEGKSLYVQASRWYVQTLRAFDLPELLEALRKPQVIQTAAIASGGQRPQILTMPPPASAPAFSTVTPGAIAATDSATLVTRMNQTVTVEGIVKGIGWTRAGNAVNIEFVGTEGDRALILWIPPTPFGQLAEAGVKLEQGKATIEGKRVLVKGRIIPYAGYNQAFMQRIEIVPEAGKDVQVLEK